MSHKQNDIYNEYRWGNEPMEKPKKMSDTEKSFWIGLLLGILITNLIWSIIL